MTDAQNEMNQHPAAGSEVPSQATEVAVQVENLEREPVVANLGAASEGSLVASHLFDPLAVTPPPPPRLTRIPHFGHVLLLLLLLLAGTFSSVTLALVALHFHLFGVSTPDQVQRSMFYNIGVMGLLYLIAFAPGAAVFPLLWRRSVLAGLQWSWASAIRLRWRLVGLGVGCAGVALALQSVLHMPHDSPIQQMLNSPQAAWLMFAFGVTVAPVCEEVLFRGFLLPAACTAFDWTREKITHSGPPALLSNEHPQWSLPAMIFGAAITSVLFALLHATQTANAKGVLVMLWSMGMVLSGIRLKTRSLAASSLTHAAYNFTLFIMVLIGTHGFRNLHQ
jgi:membrane protease YdiL (CAAX protease family)